MSKILIEIQWLETSIIPTRATVSATTDTDITQLVPAGRFALFEILKDLTAFDPYKAPNDSKHFLPGQMEQKKEKKI